MVCLSTQLSWSTKYLVLFQIFKNVSKASRWLISLFLFKLNCNNLYTTRENLNLFWVLRHTCFTLKWVYAFVSYVLTLCVRSVGRDVVVYVELSHHAMSREQSQKRHQTELIFVCNYDFCTSRIRRFVRFSAFEFIENFRVH